MNWERILEKYCNFLLSLGIPSVTARDIALPNQVFESAGKTLWFQISISRGEVIRVTENKEVVPAIVNLVVCVPVQSGTKKVNDIAAVMESKLTGKWRYFTVDRHGVKSHVYVDSVSILSGVTDASSHRVNVRISMRVYKGI